MSWLSTHLHQVNKAQVYVRGAVVDAVYSKALRARTTVAATSTSHQHNLSDTELQQQRERTAAVEEGSMRPPCYDLTFALRVGVIILMVYRLGGVGAQDDGRGGEHDEHGLRPHCRLLSQACSTSHTAITQPNCNDT